MSKIALWLIVCSWLGFRLHARLVNLLHKYCIFSLRDSTNSDIIFTLSFYHVHMYYVLHSRVCSVGLCIEFVDNGFAELATKLISIGAKYGNVAASDVLPSARTVSWHVDEVVTMKQLANIKCFGITTDGWTHDATSTPYITVTLHYIDEVLMQLLFVEHFIMMSVTFCALKKLQLLCWWSGKWFYHFFNIIYNSIHNLYNFFLLLLTARCYHVVYFFMSRDHRFPQN